MDITLFLPFQKCTRKRTIKEEVPYQTGLDCTKWLYSWERSGRLRALEPVTCMFVEDRLGTRKNLKVLLSMGRDSNKGSEFYF